MDKDQITRELNARYERLNTLTESIEKKLLVLPEGKIRILHKQNSDYYYYVDKDKNDNGTLINSNNLPFVKGVAQRSYLQKVLRAAKNEKKLIDQYMKRYPSPTVEQIYQTLPEHRRTLVTPVILPDEEYIEQWLNMPYPRKGFDEGAPYYASLNGERVRSKSEAQIADHLKVKGIPYKYECPLIVGTKIFHPDFTILRVSDRTELYYEHLGKMGDRDYAASSISRLNLYAVNGYIPGDRLFTTMESADCPFDVRVLDEMIDKNFR